MAFIFSSLVASKLRTNFLFDRNAEQKNRTYFSSVKFANQKKRRVFFLAFLFAAAVGAGTQTLAALDSNSAAQSGQRSFPALYFTEQLRALEQQHARRPAWAATNEEALRLSSQESILLNNYILAFYGHPSSRNMGILGRYSREELKKQLTELAAEYRKLSGSKEIRLAFYIIFGTVWPEGEIGYIRESVLKEWIEFAQENNMLVFIDHQIGRFTPEAGLRRMLPWLRYPNVHLAIDPEWRTTKPMLEIGTVSAAEINNLQKIMENYMIENNIPGERIFAVHQFNWRMITDANKVDASSSRVRLVHCMDGLGKPAEKKDSYAFNARFTNMPVKSFKLFYNFNIPGAGFDNPLMTPQEVMNLNPRPYVIMYQ